MQEHIRRAHPEYYIPKLPATKESFELMVNTPPHEVPQPVQQPSTQQDHWSPPSERREHHYLSQNGPADATGLSFEPVLDSFENGNSFGQALGQIQVDGFYGNGMSTYDRPTTGEYRRGSLLPAANAAAALAQLHYARPDGEWASDHVGIFGFMSPASLTFEQAFFTDQVTDEKRPNFADPTLSAEQQFLDSQYQTDHVSNGNGHHTTDLLPSAVDKSPTIRSSAPAVQRTISRASRPRKSSVSQNARRPKHERKSSKDYLKPTSHDRKGTSAEPSSTNMYGKRWEDLIDAATSATEEEGRDLTPVGDFITTARRVPGQTIDRMQIPASPFHSPQTQNRTPMAPFAIGAQFQTYTASPLQQALTPPPADPSSNLDLQPFPSVEEPSSIDSVDSGANFHIMPSNQATLSSASDSSPMFNTPVQIYCAGCRRLSILKESYACTECICGLCQSCVDALLSETARGRVTHCPNCQSMNGSFKPFQLDVR